MPIIIKNNSHQDILDLVTTKLLKKDLVALPTETVYGLAGLGTSLSAAKKIYKLKQRPLSKKLIFHCSNMDMVKKFFILEDENSLLAKKYWPGPLTLILKRKSKQIPLELSKNEYCAVRVPKNTFTSKVISLLNKPIVMPSANRFKKLSPIPREIPMKVVNMVLKFQVLKSLKIYKTDPIIIPKNTLHT